jgi:hypothetical protein
MFGLVLLSTSVSTGDLVTLKFQANKHPPLATSPHPIGSSASSTDSSRANNHALHYKTAVHKMIFVCLVIFMATKFNEMFSG